MHPTAEESMHDHYHILRDFSLSIGNRYGTTLLPGTMKIIVGLHAHLERRTMRALATPWPSFPGSAVDPAASRS